MLYPQHGSGETENLRKFSWYQAVGPDVLTVAFNWAHEADPDAQLQPKPALQAILDVSKEK